jgi:hypothetical protein
MVAFLSKNMTTLVLLGVIGFSTCDEPEKKNIEKRTPNPPPPTAMVLNAPLEKVRRIIIDLFAEGAKLENPIFDEISLYTKDDAVFPDDDRLVIDGRAREQGTSNPALSRYVEIAPSLRERDLYLYHVLDKYWESEYFWEGNPAKFNCKFIIHLEPQGGDETKIEIFQFQPVVWVGKSFGLSGHGGVGWHRDMRFVEPTVKDSADLLRIIGERVKDLR